MSPHISNLNVYRYITASCLLYPLILAMQGLKWSILNEGTFLLNHYDVIISTANSVKLNIPITESPALMAQWVTGRVSRLFRIKSAFRGHKHHIPPLLDFFLYRSHATTASLKIRQVTLTVLKVLPLSYCGPLHNVCSAQ